MRIFLYECVCAGGLGLNVPASLQREGWAMLAAIVEDFQRLPGVQTVTLLDDQLQSTLGDSSTRIPWTDEEARFHSIASECDWTLVIAPEFDNLLLARSQAVLEVGGQLLGSLPHGIRLAGDKLETAQVWHAHGVPHPRTEMVDPVEFARFGPPWVIKPRYGAGSQATYLIRDYDEKRFNNPGWRREWPGVEFIVQRYVAGEAVSVAFLIGPQQTIPLLPARQHLTEEGRFRYQGGSLPLSESLARRAIRVATNAVACVPGLQGYVGVDLVLGEEDWAIEINPRLTTSYIGIRQACRQNLAALILRCVRGDSIEAPSWSDQEVRFAPCV